MGTRSEDGRKGGTSAGVSAGASFCGHRSFEPCKDAIKNSLDGSLVGWAGVLFRRTAPLDRFHR